MKSRKIRVLGWLFIESAGWFGKVIGCENVNYVQYTRMIVTYTNMMKHKQNGSEHIYFG
jgi:hypothetical protein